MSEAEWMQDWGDEGDFDDDSYYEQSLPTRRRVHLTKKKNKHSITYTRNKLSKVGSVITCCGCGKSINKASYQTQYCSNRGSGNCKDVYWNSIR